jgi:ABC-type glycerol-3-phosphate transport system permease component
MERNMSTFWGLLDVSFSDFVTENVIKVLYITTVALALVAVIIGIIVIFTNYGIAQGVGAIILAPVVFFFFVVTVRVFFEILIVIFKIADYLEIIAENTTSDSE